MSIYQIEVICFNTKLFLESWRVISRDYNILSKYILRAKCVAWKKLRIEKKKRASDGSKLHLASVSLLVQSYLTWTTIADATELN